MRMYRSALISVTRRRVLEKDKVLSQHGYWPPANTGCPFLGFPRFFQQQLRVVERADIWDLFAKTNNFSNKREKFVRRRRHIAGQHTYYNVSRLCPWFQNSTKEVWILYSVANLVTRDPGIKPGTDRYYIHTWEERAAFVLPLLQSCQWIVALSGSYQPSFIVWVHSIEDYFPIYLKCIPLER